MPTQSRDQAVVAILAEKIGDLAGRADYDDEGNLVFLDLRGLNLSQLPAELGQLTQLQGLYLNANHLSQLPAELGQLTNLQVLYLSNNHLSQLPAELGQLTNLQRLYLHNNHLSQLPAELGQLVNLQTLYLQGNQLSRLPAELGQLTNLLTLRMEGNPNLLTPPPEIVARGTEAILSFLQGLVGNSVVRYEAKLLVVGEGGTGKSSLLKALRGEAFDADLVTTHGIEVGELRVPHPERADTEITLNSWILGGSIFIMRLISFFLRSVRCSWWCGMHVWGRSRDGLASGWRRLKLWLLSAL